MISQTRTTPNQRKPTQTNAREFEFPPCQWLIFSKKHFFHGDIAWDVLKKSICFRNPCDVLETRLLALSANIAVDSPKHCKGCKKKQIRMPGAISIFFLILQPLHGFGGVRQVTKTHFLSKVPMLWPDSGVQMTTVAHFYRAVLLPPYLVRDF